MPPILNWAVSAVQETKASAVISNQSIQSDVFNVGSPSPVVAVIHLYILPSTPDLQTSFAI